MEENQNFSTRDLYLAATLMFLKFPLVGIDFSVEGSKNQPVGYFLFNNSFINFWAELKKRQLKIKVKSS